MNPHGRTDFTARNPFLPLVLVAISLVVILLSALADAVRSRTTGENVRAQQGRLVEQSLGVQTGVEQLARGLVEVAAADEVAAALVKKYGIKIDGGVTPAASPAVRSPAPN